MASILFVRASDGFARLTYEREQRAYWSRAFEAVLEKHGYLSVEFAGPEALESPETFDAYAAVLVGRQPEDVWSPELVAKLVNGRTCTIVDGPTASPVLEALGIDAAEPVSTDGLFRVVDEALAATAAVRFGVGAATLIGHASTKEVAQDDALHWAAVGVPLDEHRAEAWRVRTWDPQRWVAANDAAVLAEWDAQDGRPPSPSVVRRGSLIASSFAMFEYLTYCQSAAPTRPNEFISSSSPLGLEAFVLTLVDRLHVERETVRVRTLPWPKDIDWALTVRHDFDRPLPPKRVQEVLQRHERVGTAATWYWRASHLARGRLRLPTELRESRESLRLVAGRQGHEVALHTEDLWRAGRREIVAVERAARRAVRGTCAHGDPSCFRFQGAPNILWANAAGMAYTENLQHLHHHPYRFAALGADGLVSALDIYCLPKHQSFDRSTEPGDVFAEGVTAAAPNYRASGGLLQVMNHPDVHIEELFDLLTQLPREGRIDWTADQTIRWWRATHRPSAAAVDGVVLETLAPDGTLTRS